MMKSMRTADQELSFLDSLRRAAASVDPGASRHYWIGLLAGGACLLYALVLTALPGQLGEAAMRLPEFRGALDQARRLGDGRLSADGLYPLGYPLSLLVLTQVFRDVVTAARAISGLSAILALYLAYLVAGTLVDEDRLDEQALFALVALSLSPAFFLAAVGGGTEMPHLVLVLASILLILRAAQNPAPLAQMALAGLLAGLAMMLRPSSLLLPLAVGAWLAWCRPFTSDQGGSNLKPALGFAAGFCLGASPQMLLALATGVDGSRYASAVAAIVAHATHDPLAFAAGVKQALVSYVAADDFERLDAVAGLVQVGAWGTLVGVAVALAPTVVKLLGLLGMALLSWMERFESSVDRMRLPALLVLLLAAAGGLGLVDERNPLPLLTLLIVFAFAGLPTIIPGVVSGVLGLALVALLVLHQVGAGYPARLAASYVTADQVAEVLREAGAEPGQVVSSSWSFYDTRSPWRERYRGLPTYVDSPQGLVRDLRRSGARYFVFDELVGAQHWPGLAALLDAERPPAGLRPLAPAIRTGQSPPNTVVIYALE